MTGAVSAQEGTAARIGKTDSIAKTEIIAKTESNAKTEILETPVKSETDQRAYRSLRLSNGLKVLLISDPHTDKAAAAMDVATGSVDDPAHRQGLAHFLEHMLFLGTAKYPQSGEYQTFISSNGGTHNAFTSLEHTNYFFDIDPAHLEDALDRFAQFFVAPTFDKAFVEREKNAVNSEYQARIRDDERRLWDVYRELFHANNPAATFSVGNLATLSDNASSQVRDDLLQFYQQHYSSNVMTLVVLGRQPLPELQQWVEQRFTAVANRQLSINVAEKPVFRDGLLPARVLVQSIKSERHLHLVFPMPSLQKYYRIKPDAYISYMLGHEGDGSLFAKLKSKGWAERLAAGSGLSNRFAATFDVDILLTEEGYRHVDDVAMLFFEAVEALKSKGVVKWQYDEQKAMHDLAFRFHEKQDAIHYVSEMANAMQYYQPVDVLRGENMMENFDADLIRNLLARLTENNMMMAITAADIQGDKKSEYYGVSYKVESVSEQVLSLWSRAHLFPTIKMPEKNPFIPDKLKLKPAPLLSLGFARKDVKGAQQKTNSTPQKIGEGKNYSLWFLQDTQHKVPKASIMVYARSRNASASVKEAAMSELFVRLLNDHLNAMLYTAGLSGLDFAISKRSRGIAFQLTGYSDKQGLLLKSVMDTFKNPVFDEERFRLVKTRWEDELHNSDKQSPYQQLLQDLPVVLAHGYWGRSDYLQASEAITLKDVQDYVLEFNQEIVADILIHGNFYQAEAVKLAQMVQNTLNLDAPRLPDVPMRVVELPPVADTFLFVDELEHNDAALIKYFQAAGDSVEQQVEMQMLAQITKSAFFQSLRTEQQVGYIVTSAYYPMARVPGLIFLVQSPANGVGDINRRVDTFIADYYQTISQQDDNWFEQQRQALLTQLQEEPKNLAEQSMEFWGDMTLNYTGFNHREEQMAALKKMTREQLLAVYRNALVEKNRRQLLLVSPGKTGLKDILDGSAQRYIHIDKPDNLKASMPSHSLQ